MLHKLGKADWKEEPFTGGTSREEECKVVERERFETFSGFLDSFRALWLIWQERVGAPKEHKKLVRNYLGGSFECMYSAWTEEVDQIMPVQFFPSHLPSGAVESCPDIQLWTGCTRVVRVTANSQRKSAKLIIRFLKLDPDPAHNHGTKRGRTVTIACSNWIEPNQTEKHDLIWF